MFQKVESSFHIKKKRWNGYRPTKYEWIKVVITGIMEGGGFARDVKVSWVPWEGFHPCYYFYIAFYYLQFKMYRDRNNLT